MLWRIVAAAVGACACAMAHASPAGNWKYTASKPDPVYRNEDSLVVRMTIDGGIVCGVYMSAWRGGMRVAEGKFQGKIQGNRISVIYEAGWANETGQGLGEFVLRAGKLHWRVLKPGPGADYMLRRAVLQRAESSVLEEPKCVEN